MEIGSNKSLFTLIAVVIFGIFLSLSYWLFQDELKSVLANVLDSSSEMINTKLDNNGLIPTDAKYFSYIVDNGSIKLTGYNTSNLTDAPTDLIIPTFIDGLPVTNISNNAFQNKGLTSVILPEGLLNIENGSFNGVSYTGAFANNKLTSIKLPKTLNLLGFAAFMGNRITTIDFGLVQTIGPDAFNGNKIKNLEIPSTVVTIGAQAFVGNPLETVTIANSVKTIGGFAFWSNNLKSITIPNSVTSLGRGFIINNPNLVEINIPKSLESSILSNKDILGKTYTNYVIVDWYESSKINYY